MAIAKQIELPGMPPKPRLDEEASAILDAKRDVQEAQKVMADKTENMIAAMRREGVARYVFHNDVDGEKVFTLDSKEALKIKRASTGSKPKSRKAKT